MESYQAIDNEQGEDYVDSEYQLGSVKVGKRIELASGVTGKLVSESNQLCPSNYNPGIVCFWEGLVSIQIEVGSKIFRITDHDSRPNPITHGKDAVDPQWISFCVGPIIYRIVGTGSRVANESRDQTYLQYRITRSDNRTAYDRLRIRRNYTDGRVD